MKLSLKRLPLIFIFFGRQPQGKKGGIKLPPSCREQAAEIMG